MFAALNSFLTGALAKVTDVYWPFVSMLLHGDGVNGGQNNTFLDGSTNNFTVTRNGNTTQGSFNPFVSTYPYAVATNGGSAYFDGTGDYLQIADNATLTPAGDFTIEFWAYPTVTSGTFGYYGKGFGIQIYATGNSAVTNWWVALSSNNTSAYFLSTYNTVTTAVNAWAHIALYRSGNNYYLSVNGTAQLLTTSVSTPNTGTSVLQIGSLASTYFVNGYISNVRYVNGTAVYGASNFTPPTAPLTAVTNTALLLGMSNAAIFDNAELNNLETVGTAQISTSVFKYGTGSVRTGSGNYLSTPMKSQFQFAAGDFTVETWAYVVNNVASAILLDCAAAGTNFGWFLEYSNARGMFFYMGTGTGGSGATYATTPALTTWTHLAVTRQSGTVRMFINGILVNTTSLPNSSVATLPLLAGAANSYTTTYYFDGYLDDIRITKGIARYTTTFTPPTAAFPNLGPTYPSGTATQRAIFGFGTKSAAPYVVSITNTVSNTGVVSGDDTSVGSARGYVAAAGYGGDKAIFGFGYISGNISMTNLVSNTGVVATDTTGVGTARASAAAVGYGSTGQAIFGYGNISSDTAITNLVSSTGVVATDTTGVGTARSQLAAAKYSTDKAVFGYGTAASVSVSMTNKVSNTGVVATDTTGVGTARYGLAAAGYGSTGQAIFAYGNISGSTYVSMSNLVSNTGVVSADTTGVGTARAYLAASGYVGDKAIFGYGSTGTNTEVTNLVSNLGVVAADVTGVGTARQALAAASFAC